MAKDMKKILIEHNGNEELLILPLKEVLINACNTENMNQFCVTKLTDLKKCIKCITCKHYNTDSNNMPCYKCTFNHEDRKSAYEYRFP